MKDQQDKFWQIIQEKVNFLKSHWTDVGILLICYLQVFLVLFYESENTSGILSWQVVISDGDSMLSLAGKWSTLISRPFMLFLFYRWLLRIIIWGLMLRKVSGLNLNLFAVHPDLSGGLGFLGYSIRYFSPIAFAISATIVGNMADFILFEGTQIIDLRLPAIGYFVFISILFTLPLFSFSGKLIDAREESIFRNDDFANGLFRELKIKLSKGYDKVTADDLKSPDYSAAGDLSAVMQNALKMRTLPFALKDIVPLWVMTGIPFIAIVLLEVPINEILKELISFVV